MMRQGQVHIFIFIAIAILSWGCSASQITITIESTPETNDKRSFYVVVRSVDRATYLVEEYKAVAAKVVKSPQDEDVLKAEPVYPGIEKQLVIDNVDIKPGMAIYFMFTNPGSKWKSFHEAPVPTSLYVVVQGGTIISEEW